MWWGLVRHRRAPISYPAEFYDGYEFRRQPFPRHPAPTTAYPPPRLCRCMLWVLTCDVRYSSNFNMSVNGYVIKSSIFKSVVRDFCPCR